MRRDRVVDDQRLVGAEVVDVEPAGPSCAARPVRIAVDAVLHVEVGLLLAAVAEHAQPRRVAP